MSTHHKNSPSKIERKAACPGCIDDPDGDTTRADEGTLCHKAAELKDFSILETDEQKSTVKKGLDYMAPFEKNALEDHKEVRLEIMDGLTSGTSDRVIVRRAKVGVHIDNFDLKFGFNSVADASENPQGICYAVGCFERWPEAQSVTVHFILPRRDEVSKHTFFRRDLPRMKLAIRQVIDVVEKFERTQDASMLKPGDACTYCGRRGTCPALAGYAITLAKRYDPLAIVEEVHSSKITDLSQAAKYLTVLKIMDKMVSSGMKHLTQLALENGGLPGPDGKPAYEIAERAGSRKITNPTIAYAILREYLEPEEIVSHCKIELSGALDAVRAKAIKGQKSKLSGEVERKLGDAGCVSSGESSHYLRKAKD